MNSLSNTNSAETAGAGERVNYESQAQSARITVFEQDLTGAKSWHDKL